ncbi:MAG: tetratricopeptide repeat protein [Nitrospirae bacterium]|nr:tetratricopeptide repeat protein [Candidatus Manganitrophaceae bacterium]
MKKWPPPQKPTASIWISRARTPIVFVFLSFVILLIYSNIFSSSFHFDDYSNIIDDPRVRSLHYLKQFWNVEERRWVGFMTFALNYHFGGLDVFGYHLVNVAIHLLNTFLVYTFVLQLFRTPLMTSTERYPCDRAPWIAFSAALLFAAHPLQTEAVTYIVQRFASLVVTFYLLALVCYIYWRIAAPSTKRKYAWYLGSLLSTLLAMRTKEVSFTIPLMFILIEFLFFERPRKMRWLSLLPFLSSLILIPLSSIHFLSEIEERLSRHPIQVSRLDYFFTQLRALMTYLRLLIWPVNQNLDYDYPVYHSLFDPAVFLSLLVIVGLFSVAFFLLTRQRKNSAARLVAFGILWFFLTISVTSTLSALRIIETLFEHRLYLPSIGLFISVSAVLLAGPITFKRVLPLRWGFGGIAVAVLCLSIATYQRNGIWKDEMTLWGDVVKKSPAKARGYNNLGIAYAKHKRFDEAEAAFEKSIALKPDDANALNNLGNVYKNHGQIAKAIEAYQGAIRINPALYRSYYNIGVVYEKEGHLEEAITFYQKALLLSSEDDLGEIYFNIGNTYAKWQRWAEAIDTYEKALKFDIDLPKFDPDLPRVYNNLGVSYAAVGEMEKALGAYQKAVELEPDYDKAHNNLGNTYLLLGRKKEAREEYRQVIKINPELVEARRHLKELRDSDEDERWGVEVT